MKLCTKCILPETYPNINFNEKGECSFCNVHVHIKDMTEELAHKKNELENILIQTKQNRIECGGTYDAIVPISGGKDSAYVAYYLKKVCKLDILAVTYDNGFLSSYAKDNVWRIANELDIDLVVLKPKWSLMKKLFAAMMKETNEFCNVCNSMGYLLLASYITRMSKVWNHTPMTFLGWVRRYEVQPGIQSFTIPEFLNIMEKNGLIEDILNDSMISKEAVNMYLKIGDPRKTSTTEYQEKTGWKVLQLAEYIDWDIKKIIEILKTELCWVFPEDSTRATHFDCDASEIKEYLKYRKHGVTQKTIISSHLIRDDRLTRDEALAILENEDHNPPEYWDTFVKKLELQL